MRLETFRLKLGAEETTLALKLASVHESITAFNEYKLSRASTEQAVQVLVFVSSKEYDAEQTLYLGVETVAVEAPLRLGNGTVREQLPFGAVPVGQLQMKAVMVHNRTAQPVQLEGSPLHGVTPCIHHYRHDVKEVLPLVVPAI